MYIEPILYCFKYTIFNIFYFSDIIDTKEIEVLGERKDLAVEFIFCLALIEVLKQLPFHPGHEDLVTYIENLCFKHFKYREGCVSCFL